MSGEIQIVDPREVEPTQPVPDLLERTLFRVSGRRLILLALDRDSVWHTRNGAVYGWVRTGHGYLAYGTERTELTAGDFLHVPTDTVHRYAIEGDRLEILAVVDGPSNVTQTDTPTSHAANDSPRVVGPDGLVPTVESPELVRETPFPDAEVLLMRVRAVGGAAAGWHHHGDNVYFGYAVDGPSETEYGSAGENVARIESRECFHVPSRMIHRDTNPTDETHSGIIWLCGGEPWVVNVDSPG
jgi:uncharacterized RmlC-like cupin family protein